MSFDNIILSISSLIQSHEINKCNEINSDICVDTVCWCSVALVGSRRSDDVVYWVGRERRLTRGHCCRV